MAITITPAVGVALEVTPIPGTLKYGEGHDIKGGGVLPYNLAGKARNGSCQVRIDTVAPTLTAILAIVSAAGAGACTVTGDVPAAQESYSALVDVAIEGDAVQVATISWKGTTEEAV